MIIAAILGAVSGVICMCLLTVAKMADEQEKKMFEDEDEDE